MFHLHNEVWQKNDLIIDLFDLVFLTPIHNPMYTQKITIFFLINFPVHFFIH